MKKWYIVMKSGECDTIYVVALTDDERSAISVLMNEAIPVETNNYSGHLAISRNGVWTRDEATVIAIDFTPGRICWDDFEEI